MDHRNLVVWITGASSGIGAALCREYARDGARIILSARRQRQLEEVRITCDRPDQHLVLPFDVAVTDEHPEHVRAVVENYSRIDILINNGGISFRGDALTTMIDVDRRIMDVNYFGPISLTRAVLPTMLEQGSGQVVAISSLLGKLFARRRSSYAASKHALEAFFDTLRAELSGSGVGVTVFSPGYVRTQISVNALTSDGTMHNRMDAATAAGISPEACAKAIVRAVSANKAHAVAGGKERLGLALHRLLPPLYRRIAARIKMS